MSQTKNEDRSNPMRKFAIERSQMIDDNEAELFKSNEVESRKFDKYS